MSCECDSQCPAATQCYCIYTYDDGICVCVCDYPMVQPAFAKRPAKPLETMVDLCIKNIELGDLAAALDGISGAGILVPAARLKTQVSLSLRKTSLADALAQLGLVAQNGEAGAAAP